MKNILDYVFEPFLPDAEERCNTCTTLKAERDVLRDQLEESQYRFRELEAKTTALIEAQKDLITATQTVIDENVILRAACAAQAKIGGIQ